MVVVETKTKSQLLFSCGDGGGQRSFDHKNIVSCSLWQFIEAWKGLLSCLTTTNTQVASPCTQDKSKNHEHYRALPQGLLGLVGYKLSQL